MHDRGGVGESPSKMITGQSRSEGLPGIWLLKGDCSLDPAGPSYKFKMATKITQDGNRKSSFLNTFG